MNARWVRIVSLALIAALLHVLVMTRLRIYGVHPEFLLLSTMAVAISGGAERGAIAGFAAGLVVDVFLPSALGLSALAYSVAGYVTGWLAEEASELPWVTSFLTAVGSLIALAVFLAVGRISGDVQPTLGQASSVVSVVVLVNAVVAPLLVKPLRGAWRNREVAW